MRLVLLLASMSLLTDLTFAQEGTEQIDTRRRQWQEHLEQTGFHFYRDERGLFTSLDLFTASCQIHIIVDPRPKSRITLKFVRDGKEILTLPGHYESVFRTTDEKLYFANFSPLDVPGCTVSAYDLNTGKELWTTDDISQLKMGGGAAPYGNQVSMRFSRLNVVPNEAGGAAIIVTGSETGGDYIAVLDRETGALLAHKIYERPRPAGGGIGGRQGKKSSQSRKGATQSSTPTTDE